MLVCYVSGHGFGHAVRVTEVIRSLWRRRPGLPVHFRTTVPPWLLQFNLEGPFTHTPCQLDVGVVQDNSLTLDPLATLRAYATLAQGSAALVRTEVEALRPLHPSAILADIPALAFDVAAQLGVPGVAMTNFSWDWIYADYVRDFPDYAGQVEALRASYARASLLLRLPMHGDLSAFPRVRDVTLVARRAALAPVDVRRRLGLSPTDRLVLLSFGGIGIALQHLPAPARGVTFITTEAGHDTAPPCRTISIDAMRAASVRYQDLVAAADVVMTKPGYGIVAECIANGTPIVYTERGRFAEYPCLVEAIQSYLPHAYISNADLYGGRWADALEAVFSQQRREPTVPLNGADVAADVLLEWMEGRG